MSPDDISNLEARYELWVVISKSTGFDQPPSPAAPTEPAPVADPPASQQTQNEHFKRGRGRPKGSKNRDKNAPPPVKQQKKPGRPIGAKNKPKDPNAPPKIRRVAASTRDQSPPHAQDNSNFDNHPGLGNHQVAAPIQPFPYQMQHQRLFAPHAQDDNHSNTLLQTAIQAPPQPQTPQQQARRIIGPYQILSPQFGEMSHTYLDPAVAAMQYTAQPPPQMVPFQASQQPNMSPQHPYPAIEPEQNEADPAMEEQAALRLQNNINNIVNSSSSNSGDESNGTGDSSNSSISDECIDPQLRPLDAAFFNELEKELEIKGGRGCFKEQEGGPEMMEGVE
ncbi:hypothetical protein ACLMJK_003963 [Lecanora helva]